MASYHHDATPAGHDYANGQNYAAGAHSQAAPAHGAGSSGINPIAPRPHQSTVSQVLDPRLGKIGNPGPLGLMSFALTTFVLGLYQTGAGLPNSDPLGGEGPDQAVFGLAVFMGGFAQIIAGIMEFAVGNTFGTTLHISYGAFWLAFAMSMVPSLGIQEAYKNDEHAISYHMGIFLIVWCFITIIFFLAALRTNIAILGVLGCLILAFFFLSLGQFVSTHHMTAATRLNRAGGVFAVICAFIAFYAGASGLMTASTTPIRFPLGEFGKEKQTMPPTTKREEV